MRFVFTSDKGFPTIPLFGLRVSAAVGVVSAVPLIGMLVVNVVICVLAVEWAGQEVLRENMIAEMNQ